MVQVLMGCVVEDVLHDAGAYGVCGRGCLTWGRCLWGVW